MSETPPAAAPPPIVRSGDLRIGYALAAVMITFFASAPNFARLAFADGIDPLTFQLIRFSVAIAGMLMAARIFGWRVRGLAPYWRSLMALTVITLIASFGYMTSVRYIQVGLASLIFFCFPILVGVLTHVLGMERVSLRGGLGFLIAFAGLVLVFGVSFEAADPRGMALALAAGIAVACGFLITRRLSRFVPSPSVSLTVICSAGIIFITTALIVGDHQWPASSTGWIGAAGAGVAYFVGLTALYETIARLWPVRSASFSNLEPLLTIAIAFVFLGERLTFLQSLGAAVVVGALLLANSGRKA